MRIAHLSDIHFSNVSWDIKDIGTKRWLGNLNLVFRRGKEFCNELPFKLIPKLTELQIETCLITGDFTSTGNDVEYAMARRWVDAIESAHIKVIAIPGNHDCYIAENMQKKTYYQHFPSRYWTCNQELNEHRCTAMPLTDGWWLVALDTTLATPLISSEGLFSEALEEQLDHCIREIPSNQKIILMNHFPFFQNERKRRRMQRGPALQGFLDARPQIQLYLHGHTHRHILADLRPSGLPIILDSGSTALSSVSSWNLIDLKPTTCDIEIFRLFDNDWHVTDTKRFHW